VIQEILSLHFFALICGWILGVRRLRCHPSLRTDSLFLWAVLSLLAHAQFYTWPSLFMSTFLMWPLAASATHVMSFFLHPEHRPLWCTDLCGTQTSQDFCSYFDHSGALVYKLGVNFCFMVAALYVT
jgi:hypothetical protein